MFTLCGKRFTMSPKKYRILRTFLLVNGCLLLLGLVRVAVVKWQSDLWVENTDAGGLPMVHRLIARYSETRVNHVIRDGANCSCKDPDVTVTPGGDGGEVVVGLAGGDQGGDDANHVPDTVGKDFDNSTEFQVPNIVHYIWFNTEPRKLQFHHMLSILSAHKILNPDVIYFHTNCEPTGAYWDRVRVLPKMKVMYRDPPLNLFGEKVKDPFFYTSHSNVDRVNILMEYGGIYLDFDVLVTKPFDDLRRHVCTIGLERDTQACGSVIVCSKSSVFLLMWINSYLDDYRITEWAYNTGKVPFNLARRYPHLVNVEKTKLNRPNFHELDQIWGPKWFDWQQNYAVHIWYRLWKDMSPYFTGVEPNEENVKTWNTTFGEMARSVLYGTTQIMSADSLLHD